MTPPTARQLRDVRTFAIGLATMSAISFVTTVVYWSANESRMASITAVYGALCGLGSLWYRRKLRNRVAGRP